MFCFIYVVNDRGEEDAEKQRSSHSDPIIGIFIKVTELPMAIDPNRNKVVHRDHAYDEDCKVQEPCFQTFHDITSHYDYISRI